MSKSKKNVIDPSVLLAKYGADTTRLFCLFAAPPERDLEWSEQGVDGSARFLNRIWRLTHEHYSDFETITSYQGAPQELTGQAKKLYRKTHQTINRVTRDIEGRFHFNTAISAVMELVNEMYSIDVDKKDDILLQVMKFALETTVLLLSPVVPHFAEELWQILGHQKSVIDESWPSFREDALKTDNLLIVVQVNGKLRSRLTLPADITEDAIKEIALADERVQSFIQDKPIRKVIVVKKKLVNIVI
jgi:leucyl-tRNA synthetase